MRELSLRRKQRNKASRERVAWTPILAGLAGGLAGGWTMSQFSRAWNKILPSLRNNSIGASCRYSAQEWDSINRSAEWIAAPFVSRKLSSRETRIGSAIVHYAIGGAAGALYATAAHWLPRVTKFGGVGFGIALWLVGDEIVMPAFGLTAPARRYSFRMRANALGEHLVYAFTVNLVYRRLTGRGTIRPRNNRASYLGIPSSMPHGDDQLASASR